MRVAGAVVFAFFARFAPPRTAVLCGVRAVAAFAAGTPEASANKTSAINALTVFDRRGLPPPSENQQAACPPTGRSGLQVERDAHDDGVRLEEQRRLDQQRALV